MPGDSQAGHRSRIANVVATEECRELAAAMSSTAVAEVVADAQWRKAAQQTADAFATFLAAVSSAVAAATSATASLSQPECSSQPLPANLTLLRLHH